MGRPRKKDKRTPTNLTLDREIKQAAKAFAYEQNLDLSELVEKLLLAEMANSAQSKKAQAGQTRPPASPTEKEVELINAVEGAHRQLVEDAAIRKAKGRD